MSWFGETFGDSLNSLKGQITKITKEVLAEDENENEGPDSVKLKLKEFEALCASKDVEIDSLRQENVRVSERFQEELQLLRNENKKLKADFKKIDDGNVFFGDDQIKEICELENQLQQIKIERDHLEELQKDHQSNICLVVQQRDSYKQELEKIKGTHSALQAKYEELLKAKDNEKGVSCLSDVNLIENQMKEDELINLRETIEKLQTQIESCQNEKEEMSGVIERHELSCENMKEKIKKLVEEVKILSEEKKAVDSENEELRHTVNRITSNLNSEIDNLKAEEKMKSELEDKVKELTQTLDAVKIEQTDFERNLESQVKKLTSIFFANDLGKYTNISLSSLVSEIENFWKNISTEKEANDKIYAETLNQLENDIKCLKSNKFELEKEMKVEMDKKNELESNYKKEINLLQSKYLKLKSEEQECIIKSQTDDVKRLNQEVSKLMEVIESKNNELSDCYKKLNTVTQELNTLRTMSVNTEHELFRLASEKEEFEKTLRKLESDLGRQENEIQEIMNNKNVYQEKCKIFEDENALLLQKYNALQDQLNEANNKNKGLEDNINSLEKFVNRLSSLEKDLQETVQSKAELEKICAEMQKMKLKHEKDWENLKAQLIIKESKITEQNVNIQQLTQELSECKENISKLQAVEDELNKCKEIIVEMDLDRQDLSEERERIKKECNYLKSQISMHESHVEIDRLKRENANLREVCKKLQILVQNKNQNDILKVEIENINGGNPEIKCSLESEADDLRSYAEQQANVITGLTHENNELKHQLQLANENVNKLSAEICQLKQEEGRINSQETADPVPSKQGRKNSLQQHRRSKSDFDTAEDVDSHALRLELENLKEISQRQIDEYKILQDQYNVIIDKEAHSKKELERLRLHLIETENYYVETIDEYKAKLGAAEEQLKNCSTLYTSNKVRDNQHLESLQSQIRLISAQRDSLHEQLSAAQDEIQKQKAALVSFHVVLEQFQQDKERECKSLAVKFENQLSLSDKRFAELEQEKESLNVQLLDAKNGLKAASRLGEQLEKKNGYIADLEGKVAKMEGDMKELEERAKLVHQSEADKVDKSLLKNLLLGYISSQKTDRKEQVLRIMMSVLDFDEEERNKIGIDSSQSGWLSSLLHPKGDGVSNSQSLSEAFIRFLENESRPQPQLKLLPERPSITDKSKSRSTTPKPALLLQELVLPTFNSPQSSESTILKDVLKNT